jgi:formate dehydrogenase subunit delta
MSPEKLIYMSNQIAHSFKSRSYDEAVAATADHISSFWEPRMRSLLFKLMDENDARFESIVRDARPRIRPVGPIEA